MKSLRNTFYLFIFMLVFLKPPLIVLGSYCQFSATWLFLVVLKDHCGTWSHAQDFGM